MSLDQISANRTVINAKCVSDGLSLNDKRVSLFNIEKITQVRLSLPLYDSCIHNLTVSTAHGEAVGVLGIVGARTHDRSYILGTNPRSTPLADRLEKVAYELRGRRKRPPDPFATIRLQQRLSILSEQIRKLEDDQYVYAKNQRLIAHRAAYDDLLDEAFELAGLPVPEQGRGEARRLDAELELAGRGWHW